MSRDIIARYLYARVQEHTVGACRDDSDAAWDAGSVDSTVMAGFRADADRMELEGQEALRLTDLARNLFVHGHDEDGATQQDRDKWADNWDNGQVSASDRAAYYEDADRIISGADVIADEEEPAW